MYFPHSPRLVTSIFERPCACAPPCTCTRGHTATQGDLPFACVCECMSKKAERGPHCEKGDERVESWRKQRKLRRLREMGKNKMGRPRDGASEGTGWRERERERERENETRREKRARNEDERATTRRNVAKESTHCARGILTLGDIHSRLITDERTISLCSTRFLLLSIGTIERNEIETRRR